MREIAVESAARVVDAVEQTGLVMLLNELVGPMQERTHRQTCWSMSVGNHGKPV